MLFDDRKYPYHIMLRNFILSGGQDAFFDCFHMAFEQQSNNSSSNSSWLSSSSSTTTTSTSTSRSPSIVLNQNPGEAKIVPSSPIPIVSNESDDWTVNFDENELDVEKENKFYCTKERVSLGNIDESAVLCSPYKF